MINAIYSSDLKRASDTAKIISKFFPKLKVHYTKELREIDIGELEGKDKFMPHILLYEKGLHYKAGESHDDFYYRAKGFLKKIYSKHKKDTILIVGHNGIIKALSCVIKNNKPIDMINEKPVSNAGIVWISVKNLH